MTGAVAGRVEVESGKKTKTLRTIPRNAADFQKTEIVVIIKTFSISLKKPCMNQNLSL